MDNHKSREMRANMNTTKRMATLAVITMLVIISSYEFVTHAQSTDCGSGVPQRLEVGGQGQVIPGQARNRLRSAPFGDPIGFIETNTIFDVIGGPECNGNILWWQVSTSDGLTGWTAEGVDGEAYLEPVAVASGGGGGIPEDNTQPPLEEGVWADVVPADVDLTQPVINTGEACDNIEPQNNIGDQVYLRGYQPFVRSFEGVDVYYGHPLIPGQLYSGRRLEQYVRYQERQSTSGLTAVNRAPVCHNE